jgi:AcrR family transcriptional regulator
MLTLSAMTKSEGSKSERTRSAILTAAQALFAEVGYERTTVREIAARAEIDPAMVIRYFGSKDELFARAAVFDLRLPDLTSLKPSQLGTTLAAHFLDLWEGPSSSGGMVILLRAAASNDDAATKVRAIFSTQVVPMLAQVIDRAELPTRAGLIASQLLGFALCRYVLKVPPAVAMRRDDVIKAIGATLQRYVNGKLE